ncbi:hypothetical protein Tco_0313620 [Tanacetum coccineum]
MESEFMALAATGKEVEWLKNFLLEIPLWSKPITLISIHCDSVATLAKAYSQMYNGKSRHLGVRHSMIRPKHMYLHIIPRMCLEAAEKEDEVFTSQCNSVVRRLILAASVYNIWQERNGRIFKDVKRSSEEVFKCVVEVVKNRLIGLTLKDSSAVKNVENKWMISCKIDNKLFGIECHERWDIFVEALFHIKEGNVASPGNVVMKLWYGENKGEHFADMVLSEECLEHHISMSSEKFNGIRDVPFSVVSEILI